MTQALATILTRLDAIAAQAKTTGDNITMDLTTFTQKLQASNAALVATVAPLTSTVAGVKAALEGEAAQLAALKQQIADQATAAGIPDDVAQSMLASVDAVTASTVANIGVLTDAVHANVTPA